MTGKSIGVLGLGRSGAAVAKAAAAKGATPIVFDEKSKAELGERAATVANLGIETRLGWKGSFLDEGLDLLVTSPGVPMHHPRLQEAARSGIEVISEVEWAFRIAKAPIVAITGTNGKSTTTVMTWLCLRAAGEDALLCGNIYGSGYGSDEELPLTEAAMQASADQLLVAEVSSFQLEWVRDFKPVVAGITNIAPDHLDRYESFEEYAAMKKRIFARQGAGELSVVRSNDPVVRPPQGPRVFTFGTESGDARAAEHGLKVLDEEVIWSELDVPESHNRLNAAMASALTVAFLTWREHGRSTQASSAAPGKSHTATVERVAPIAAIASGLKQFHGLAHRMERLGERRGVLVINNSMCTNPTAVVVSASSVPGRKHLLLGGTNKKLDFKPLADYMDAGLHSAYIYGRDSREVNAQLGSKHPVFERMAEAFRAATEKAKPGEVIMLAPGCASQDQFKDFRDRGNVFREIAKEWLRS